MRQVSCKNCGATFPGGKERCPYCNTMTRAGSQKGVRAKISEVINKMLGIRDEAYESLSRMILAACLRSLLIVAAILLLAFGCSQLVDVNYQEDYDYDLRTQQNIEWAEENLDKLEEAYAAGDFKTIELLSYQNYDVVASWQHYPEFELRRVHREVTEAPRFDAYELRQALYFLFNPEYFVGRNRMANMDEDVYKGLRQDVLDRLQQRGYTEQELHDIYDRCVDSHGYLFAGDLEEFVKGGDHA